MYTERKKLGTRVHNSVNFVYTDFLWRCTEFFEWLYTVRHINSYVLLLSGDSMPKRRYVLDPLATFQRKLEDFFKTKQLALEQQQQASKAYLETVYQYHLKGMSLREISEVTGVPNATLFQWIHKIKKQKEKASALPEASDYIKEAKELKESMEKSQ